MGRELIELGAGQWELQVSFRGADGKMIRKARVFTGSRREAAAALEDMWRSSVGDRP
jgi:hypothetical protein